MMPFSIYPTIAASSDGQAIVSVTGALQNYVPTFSNSTSLSGNPNLTFDGSRLTVLGDIVLGNQNSITLANNGTLEIDVSNQLTGANTLKFPANASGILTNNGSGELSWVNDPTTGDVSGPGEVTTANQIALFSDTFGNQIKNSVVQIDSGALSGITSLKLTNNGTMQIDVADQGSATNTLTIPVNATGILSNDGAGTLSWGPPPVITSAIGADDNNIAVFSGSDSLEGTSNLTFDGSTLSITGDVSLGDGNSLILTNNGTMTISAADLNGTDIDFTLPPNSTGVLICDGDGNKSWSPLFIVQLPFPGSITAGDIPVYYDTSGYIFTESSINITDQVISKIKNLKLLAPNANEVTIAPNASSSTHTIKLPSDNATGYLSNDGAGNLSWGTPGNVLGAAGSTDNAIVRFDGDNGHVINNSSILISNSGEMTNVASIELKNNVDAKFTFKIADDGGGAGSFNLIWPNTNVSGYLSNDGAGNLLWGSIPQGDVVGPLIATNNAIVLFDQTTGKLIKDSSVLISGSREITGVASIALDGSTSGTLTIQAGATTDLYTITMPASNSDGLLLKTGSVFSWNGNYVTGPASATENNIAVYDGSSGKIIKNSSVSISGSTVVASALNLTNTGNLIFQTAAQDDDYTYTFPSGYGSAGTFLQTSSDGVLTWAPAGDVTSTGVIADNAIARFDQTTGNVIKSSPVLISNTGEITGAKSIELKSNADAKFTFKIADGGSSGSFNLTWPHTNAVGYLSNTVDGDLSWASISSSGDVFGPGGGSTDHAIVRFDLATGKLIQNSSVLISDDDHITGVASIALDGATSGTLTIQAAATTNPNYTINMPESEGVADTVLTHVGSGEYLWKQPSSGLINFTSYLSTGAIPSWTSHDDTAHVHVICIGGGGGSCGTASGDLISVTSGACSGGIVDVWVTITTSPSTASGSVGDGGNSGSQVTSATAGGDTTFNINTGSPLITAAGGNPGIRTNGTNLTVATIVNSMTPAANTITGGTTTIIVDTNSKGGDGIAYGGSGSLLISGQGGGVPGFSVGAKSQIGIIGTTADQDGNAGQPVSYGAGASGSCNATGNSNTNGANGVQGLIMVWEYKY